MVTFLEAILKKKLPHVSLKCLALFVTICLLLGIAEHPVGDDSAPPKGARASRLRPTSMHRIAINGRMQHFGTHLPDLRVERAQLHVERRLSQLQQPDHFDNVRHAGGRLGMTDVALDGAHRARFVTAFFDNSRDRADLDRIAQPRSGAVGFHHVSDRGRSVIQRGLDQQLL